jgi:hypothetical protein
MAHFHACFPLLNLPVTLRKKKNKKTGHSFEKCGTILSVELQGKIQTVETGTLHSTLI